MIYDLSGAPHLLGPQWADACYGVRILYCTQVPFTTRTYQVTFSGAVQEWSSIIISWFHLLVAHPYKRQPTSCLGAPIPSSFPWSLNSFAFRESELATGISIDVEISFCRIRGGDSSFHRLDPSRDISSLKPRSATGVAPVGAAADPNYAAAHQAPDALISRIELSQKTNLDRRLCTFAVLLRDNQRPETSLRCQMR